MCWGRGGLIVLICGVSKEGFGIEVEVVVGSCQWKREGEELENGPDYSRGEEIRGGRGRKEGASYSQHSEISKLYIFLMFFLINFTFLRHFKIPRNV
jgi:hypothetical protein